MKTIEEELYQVCSNFCRSFFHLMCVKNEKYMREMYGGDLISIDIELEMNEKRVFSNINRLKEVIKKVDEKYE